jgi:hypothetical protein
MRNSRCNQHARLLCLALCMAPCAALFAQETPAPSAPAAVPARPAPKSAPRAGDIPRPDQLEPGVDTTPAPAPTSTTATAPAAAPPAAPGAPAAAARPGSAARKGPDRLELETTDITGNRELPKVLYIVPWKRSDLSDLTGKPPNSLLDEVLQPIDRDVFQRENRYYDALKPDAKGAKTGTAPLSGDKP